MEQAAAWLALAYRSALSSAEAMRIAMGEGPNPAAYDAALLAREKEDVQALFDLGVRLVPIASERYPARLREEGPLVLQVAGRLTLLYDEDVPTFTKVRGPQGQALFETLESGGRAVVVLSKGMLKARSLLAGFAQHIEDGAVTLISAEPPRAAWGPTRDVRRDRLAAQLRPTRPASGDATGDATDDATE